jgi:hypothetical protein
MCTVSWNWQLVVPELQPDKARGTAFYSARGPGEPESTETPGCHWEVVSTGCGPGVAQAMMKEDRPDRGCVRGLCAGQQPPRTQLVLQQGISSRYERRVIRGLRVGLTAGGFSGRVF